MGSPRPERDGALHAMRSFPHPVAIISASHDPITAVVPDNEPDVVGPHHYHAGCGSARVTPMGPVASEVELGAAAEKRTQIPAAPGVRPIVGGRGCVIPNPIRDSFTITL